jgi:hypothetical protein
MIERAAWLGAERILIHIIAASHAPGTVKPAFREEPLNHHIATKPRSRREL